MKKLFKFILIFIILLFNFLFSALGIDEEQQYFSPNLDGVKDTITLPFNIKDKNLIEWKVIIAQRSDDKKFRKVREYVSDNPKRKNLNFERFFERIFSRDKIVPDPNSVVWDGKDEQFKPLADGIYYIKIEAEDRFGNKSSSKFIPIILDTKPPKVELKAKDKIFSPNGDGRKEKLVLDINFQSFDEFDQWDLAVLNEAGQEVYKAEGNKDTLFEWDGRDNNNKALAEGNYLVKIKASDLAGNRSGTREERVVLITSFEEAKLASSLKAISPNGDGYFDETELTGEISSLVGLDSWELNIYSPEREKINQLNLGDNFVKKINYNGVNKEGKILKDGIYTAKIIAKYDSGNMIESNPVEIKIDNTPPEMKVEILNDVFNPKSRVASNRALKVEQSLVGDKQGKYKGFMKNENGEIIYNKDFGAKLPKNFTWNGRDDNGQLVGGDYVYTLVGEDEVGNISVVESKKFNLITDQLNVDFRALNSSFSPNGDGRLDKARFEVKLPEAYKKIFQKGIIKILDKNKREVKRVELDKFQPNWQWDGVGDRNRSSNKPAEVLSDDRYFYTFEGSFSTGEKINSPLKSIYLDTTPVKLDISLDEKVFSPNGDGNKDTITFNNNLTPSQLRKEADEFNLSILDSRGRVYQSFEWKGKIPNKIAWGGKTKNKTPAPDNLYRYQIKTRDHALNEATYTSEVFKLVTKFEEIDFTLNHPVVSQVPQAKITTLRVKPELSNKSSLKDGLEMVNYSLADKSGLNSLSVKKSNTLLDEVFDFTQINILPSQDYVFKAEAFFESGNQVEAEKNIYLDNTYPKVQSVTEPDLFSPDGDDKNEILNLNFIAEDNYGLSRVTSWIYRKEEFKDRKAFEQSLENYRRNQLPIKTWNWAGKLGPTFNRRETWNGRVGNELKVESATEYIIFSEVEDRVGLITVGRSSFLVDILVEELADGRLKIILNNINFEFDSDKMIGSYQKTLALLIRMLNRFPDYAINIVGHTDSRGSDSYNQRLSERRSKKVFDFLRSRGVNNPSRLSHRGVGEKELLIKNEVVNDNNLSSDEREKLTEDNYRKNRRVEFYLKNTEANR